MTARPNPRTNLRAWLFVAVKAAVTLALLAWLLTRIDLGAALARLADIDPVWAVASVVIMVAQILLTGWRWALIARVIGAPLALEPALRLTIIGHFFSQTLPSAIGGDAVRAFLAAGAGMPGGKAASSVIIDRVTALVLMVVLMGALLPLFFERVPDLAWRTGMSILVAGSVGGLALFLWLGESVALLLHRHRFTAPFAVIARDFRRVLIGAPESKLILVSAIVVHLCVATGAYAITRGLGLPLSLIDCWVMIPPIVLATTLPISIAGWGVREGASVALLAFVGISPGDALATSVALGLVMIVVGIPGGLLWLGSRK